MLEEQKQLSRAQRIAEAAEQIRIKSELLRDKLKGDDYIAYSTENKGSSQ